MTLIRKANPSDKKISTILAALSLTSFVYASSSTVEKSTSLTIYKDGALIHQVSPLPLTKGKTHHHLYPIAKTIMTDSLVFCNSVAIKQSRILEAHLNHHNSVNALTLNLLQDSHVNEANNSLDVTYLFDKIGWNANYAFSFTQGFKTLRINGWVEIVNNSGIPYENAHIQLIDANLPPTNNNAKENTNKQNPKSYIHPITVDITHDTPKRVQWISSEFVKVKQDYRVFVGDKFLEDMDNKTANPIVQTWITLSNSSSNGLGTPLPKGSAILYSQNSSGQLNVLGKTLLNHVDANQEISVQIPASSQAQLSAGKEIKLVETELEQNQFRRVNDTHVTENHYKLDLKNNSNEQINIRVVLDMPTTVVQWEIVRETLPHETQNGDNAYWNMKIPAKSTATLKYQIRYITN